MFKIWIQAIRPKSLLVSMAPVLMAVAMASVYVDINWLPAVICLLFAVMAQIVSNLINDYSDGVRGSDKDRIGPERMVASGKISAKAMLRAVIIMTCLSFILGCTLLYWGGWILLPFGIVIILGALAYSAGPFPLSRHALGDVAVVLFYGIAPVVLTYFILTGGVNYQLFVAGIAIGIVTDNMLIVNNYRDAEQDKSNGKITTVTIFGRPFMKMMYILNPVIAVCLGFIFLNHIIVPWVWLIAVVPYLAYSVMVSKKFAKYKGSEFNKLIGMSSLGAILFALTVVVTIIIEYV